jgi:transformation/transcription domain-associated protein
MLHLQDQQWSRYLEFMIKHKDGKPFRDVLQNSSVRLINLALGNSSQQPLQPGQLHSALVFKPIFMKLGMYIMAPETISTAYFINPSHQSVCSPIIARQKLGKNFTVATNTPATVEELLDALFCIRSVSRQRKVGD